MADIVDVTELPVRVTAASLQDLRLAFDAEDLDVVDLQIFVSEGSSVVARMLTNMQNESENGWIVAGTFATTSANGAAKLNLTQFLRFLRWEITSAGNATFTITGMGRRWS